MSIPLIEHTCPACGSTTLAPCERISAGDAGVLQCQNCGEAFHIYVDFRKIPLGQRDLDDEDPHLTPEESFQRQAEEHLRRRQDLIFQKQELQQRLAAVEAALKEVDAQLDEE